MKSYKNLIGKKLSLILWNTEDEDDVRVLAGEIVEKDNELYFTNKPRKWNLHLDDEKLERIKEVTEEVKKALLDADYCLLLRIAPLPDDSTEGLIPAGINLK